MPGEVAARRRDPEAQFWTWWASFKPWSRRQISTMSWSSAAVQRDSLPPSTWPVPLPGSVVEKDHFGGQITITSEVVNYPGVGRTSGTELTETMRKQAEGFGAEFLLAEVTGLELSGDVKTVRTGRGDLKCFGILLATGAPSPHGGLPG